MKTSEKGLAIIKDSEGCKLQTYLCPAGIFTIGYGHTGKDVLPNMKITQEQAEALLRKDLETFENYINKVVTVPLTQNQFDALVSFTYNVGNGNLGKSSLLKHLNRKEYELASNEFLKWNKANGQVLPGLTKRRTRERDLFNSIG